jgi:hypothetical protein
MAAFTEDERRMTSSLYFNEIDPFAAEWIGNLYPGSTIDTRSIADVQPDDVRLHGRCHFFGGIAGWEHALELAGWPISRNIWTGSCPCQPYSDAGKRAATTIPATSGPSSDDSSPSASLQHWLESKLRARMDANGSPEYALTWKHWDMPSGPPILALRGSARRISDNAFSGWPTPRSMDATSNVEMPEARFLREARGGMNLPTAVLMAGWGTPSARDGKDCGAALEANPDLVETASRLPRQVLGATSTSSPAGTASPGVLNAGFSRWLMGFPANGATRDWDACSPGWESWATVQRLLGESSSRPDEIEAVA